MLVKSKTHQGVEAHQQIKDLHRKNQKLENEKRHLLSGVKRMQQSLTLETKMRRQAQQEYAALFAQVNGTDAPMVATEEEAARNQHVLMVAISGTKH